jgi:hypothetical protein
MVGRYQLQNIRNLLNEGFTREELRQLCYDFPVFRIIYNHLPSTTAQPVLVEHLLKHAQQTYQIETLLIWAKAHNPARYKIHYPYYHVPGNGVIGKPGLAKTVTRPKQPAYTMYDWFWLSIFLMGTIVIVSLGFSLFILLVR